MDSFKTIPLSGLMILEINQDPVGKKVEEAGRKRGRLDFSIC